MLLEVKSKVWKITKRLKRSQQSISPIKRNNENNKRLEIDKEKANISTNHLEKTFLTLFQQLLDTLLKTGDES